MDIWNWLENYKLNFVTNCKKKFAKIIPIYDDKFFFQEFIDLELGLQNVKNTKNDIKYLV